MFIRILGSATGRGLPKWNCGCKNCEGIRSSRISAKPRAQSQVTVSSENKNWHLLNTLPNLCQQIHEYPELHPGNHELRDSPIRPVLLTNADIDHTLGLLLLRESQPLKVYATDFVRGLLKEGNAYFRMLEQFPGQTEWQTLNRYNFFELSGMNDKFPSGLSHGLTYFQARLTQPPEDADFALAYVNPRLPPPNYEWYGVTAK
jgi:pyrroloquinoline quinone biosynthesis protein B